MLFSIIGLGRMGLSLGQLAVTQGHRVVGWDPSTAHARPQLTWG
jgi:3-hydroxyisobutyrate dehydrogenase-like beta-hydroxyacid dehydrogenase